MNNRPQTSGSFPSRIGAIRMEATHIAAKVNVLPDHIFNTAYPVVMQQAAIESFYVSVRTLIEFLGVRPARQDVSAAETLPGWSPTLTQNERDGLIAHWEDASKHLVHFSQIRTQPVDTEEVTIRKIADDVLVVWDQFAAASAHPLVPSRANNSLYK